MRACIYILLKSAFYLHVLVKPTLLFMQIALYCMTYTSLYKHTQANCIEIAKRINHPSQINEPPDNHVHGSLIYNSIKYTLSALLSAVSTALLQ